MPPPFLILRIQPAGIETQIELPLHPCRHLTGRRLVRFLWLGIHSSKPVVTIPVRANVGRDDVSRRVNAVSDQVPIAAVRLHEGF